MTFDELKRNRYQRVAVTPEWRAPAGCDGSDIVLHLPVLEYLASQCEHCTEFGVREAHSTVALLSGCRGKVVSYDIQRSPAVDLLEKMDLPCPWQFCEADTSDPSLAIEPTDLLFIDTLHTYDHVSKELALHGRKARKFLAFHDTFTCGEKDRSGRDPSARGILPAIHEFLEEVGSKTWRTCYRTEVNNGLWVLMRSY